MPKGADNESLVLEAARHLFLERGYAATSMDAVARAAGVSKATVYACFGSKDELFTSMVERQGAEQTVMLDTEPSDDVDGALRRFGREAADLLLSPPVVAFQRIVASEAGRTPHVGELFYDSGPKRLISGLADHLERAMRRGDLRPSDPWIAATQFLAIIVGELQLRVLMGFDDPGPEVRREVVDSGVDVFLRGYAAPS